MLESPVQTKIMLDLRKRGWFVRKIIQTNKPGDPDLYAYKQGRTIWIECKRPGKTARPLQEFRGDEIIQSGMEWYQADSYEKYESLNLFK